MTLPGTGEPDCEPGTCTTLALLTIADNSDVPVGCGRNTPLIGDRDRPEEWRTEVNRWGTAMLPEVDPEPLRDAEQLPWSERLLQRMATLDSPAARTVHQMATSRPTLDGTYPWDELAAMTAIDADLVTIESMTVGIGDNGAITRDPSGVAVAVAVNADADAASQEFLRTLNGGTLPAVVPLTTAELDYMMSMAAIDSRSNATLAHVYDAVARAEGDLHVVAAAFVNEFVAAIAALVADLDRLKPPPSLAEAHANYVELLTHFVASKEDLLAAVAEADGTDLDQLMADATTSASLADIFDRARDACQVLEDYSFLHNGPRPCSSAAQQ